MNAATKLSALNRFRSLATGLVRQLTTKILVVYDVQVKNPEVPHVPLIINYGELPPNHALEIYTDMASLLDLPKAVEEYAHRYGIQLFLLLLNSRTLPTVSPLLLPRVIPVPG
jgi:translation initiation factor 4A